MIHVGDAVTTDEVVFGEPGDLEILGARTLGGMNLRVDPREKIRGGRADFGSIKTLPVTPHPQNNWRKSKAAFGNGGRFFLYVVMMIFTASTAPDTSNLLLALASSSNCSGA